ncbi:hypothetical protein BDR04DRAFT_1101849 [Suillus decipiens]|nr:hypothetical protein BDR04DRAFT_1101849 [Suillus decipiens]
MFASKLTSKNQGHFGMITYSIQTPFHSPFRSANVTSAVEFSSARRSSQCIRGMGSVLMNGISSHRHRISNKETSS